METHYLSQDNSLLRINQLFEAQAYLHPDLIAVKFHETQLSYQELNDRASIFSKTIVAAAPHSGVVGVSSTRSVETIIALLAIWKAGKTYLPLDPSFPQSRLRDIITDSGIDTVIAPEAEVLLFEPLIERVITHGTVLQPTETIIPLQSQPAYILYTSGSTGKPKGVVVGHQGIVNLIKWHAAKANFKTLGSATLQFAPLVFDASVMEIFGTLCTGGTLVLIDEETRIDPLKLLSYIQETDIRFTLLPFVALQYLAEAALESGNFPTSLMELATGGEQLKISPQIQAFFKALPNCVFYNMYGPTEASVVSTALKMEGDPDTWPLLPGIGTAVAGLSVHVLDDSLQPLAAGMEGELHLSGPGLAIGYLNRPELNADRFLEIRDVNGETLRAYRTGDLCRMDAAGGIEFLGRKDDQVKISGNRVEIGEIEARLDQIPGLTQSVVVVRTDIPGQQKLVAYFSGQRMEGTVLRQALQQYLPDYMIPAVFIWLPDFERTSSGKIDKNALPLPRQERPELSVIYSVPKGDLEIEIAAVLGKVLQFEQIGREDNFFEMGGNSLLAIQFITLLSNSLLKRIPTALLYQYPTVKGLAAALNEPEELPIGNQRFERNQVPGGDVAVIGMAVRFPGADTLEQLWEILTEGRETISFFKPEELDGTIPDSVKLAENYVPARGIIAGARDFDAEFFGISPKAAALMDPQQRLFLELAWEALQSSGHLPGRYTGVTGVFAGSGNNTYYTKNVLSHKDLMGQLGDVLVTTLNEKDYIATRTAYALDLKGPAVNVQSACSTSLLAIVQAAESIRNGRCEVALAGGASVHSPVNSGHLYQQDAMLSADGHCRAFDEKATGTVFSDGAGVVVLKSLAAAERDGDTIYAVLKGLGLNNDGGDKGSFSAPSASGQAGAIAMAISDAGIDPADISYVEAHGTGTPLGDPIEIEGLKMAFGAVNKQQYCAVGSIKSNMGHMVAAAGVAGFIKTVMALQHQQIPPSLLVDQPNPEIDFETSPFFVNTGLRKWGASAKRIAGVSSFGVGGTNVHVILEEYPQQAKRAEVELPIHVISWSAKTEVSAAGYADKLADFVAAEQDLQLGDLAYTLANSGHDFKHRRFVLAENRDALIAQLKNFKPDAGNSSTVAVIEPEVVFMFPGQGAQYQDMGQELFAQEPVFAAAIAECLALLPGKTYAELIGGKPEHTQLGIFLTEYAMARLWISRGINPARFVGHSIGEFVAAHLAGVFSLADVLNLVASRARLVMALPAGRMLSVRMPIAELAQMLPPNLSIAARNTDQLSVVSGPAEAIDNFSLSLKAAGVPSILLKTSHAFHSAMMEPALADFEAVVRGITLNKPQLPMVSTVTGLLLTDAEAMDPVYWTQHLRRTVNFAAAIKTLANIPYQVLLEVGPGSTLAVFARQQAVTAFVSVIAGLEQRKDRTEYAGFHQSLGRLWLSGLSVHRLSSDNLHHYNWLRLPTYVFDQKRYWLDIVPSKEVTAGAEVLAPAHADRSDIAIPVQDGIRQRLNQLFEQASGISMQQVVATTTFQTLGFDSLLLTQIAAQVNKTFKVQISFRKLFETYNTMELLGDFLNQHSDLPAEVTVSATTKLSLTAEEIEMAQKPFGAGAKIEKKIQGLTADQYAFLDRLTIAYNRKTAGSKSQTQSNRSFMADPRVVSGFRPLTKELVYPIIVNKSSGSHLWDVDGNVYVDALNGFGSSLFGYQPEFIRKALHTQIDQGYEIGPQHELAADVCRLICDFTGFDRAGLCNTGSEAVLGAMRIARSVTNKHLIVAFSGSYHGIVDEVLVRGTRQLRSIPAASGIMPEAVSNMLILDYGTEESLKIIQERAHEIAAVLVEPVQGRRPDFQPVAYLKTLRALTAGHQIALIFDEIITGFRMHPGGAQALFGIKADLATYGKVIGGGLSIGVVAGISRYMDALDGGFWAYGDESVPEVGVTYFAGTFVRHPLALASTKASLEHLRSAGPALQEQLNALTASFVVKVQDFCVAKQLPLTVVSFGSLWRFRFLEETLYPELLFTLMRLKGVHIQDGFSCFMTTAHSPEDIELILRAFKESAEEMINAGFFELGEAAPIVVPLTESQLEIWTACRIGGLPASCAYNDTATLIFEGEWNESAMLRAVQSVSDRHESLRSTFSADGKQMIIAAHVEVPVEQHDLSGMDAAAQHDFLQSHQQYVATTALDLTQGPLFKAFIFKLGLNTYQVKLLMHHIICDGWSLGLILQDLSKLYNANSSGGVIELPHAPKYSDYALEQHRKQHSEAHKATVDYWLDQFKTLPPVLDIPVDHPRPASRTYASARFDQDLDLRLVAQLRELGKATGTSFVTTMLAAFEVFLHQLSGQDDLVVGLPAAGQAASGTDQLVGQAVNLLPLRSQLFPGEAFVDYLRRRSAAVMEAYDHQEYTFGALLKALNLPRIPGRIPLVPVLFNIDMGMDLGLNFNELSHQYRSEPRAFEAFEIFLNITDHQAPLTLEWSYNTGLFEHNTIKRMSTDFVALLESLTVQSSQKVSRERNDTPILVKPEDLGFAQVDYPAETPVHELISAKARQFPEAIAVSFAGRTVTYKQLNESANQLAALLIAAGLKPQDKLAIAMDRSAEMVIAILAVMKTGASYVPLDPIFPVERINYMLQDAQVSMLLVNSVYKDSYAHHAKLLVLDEIWTELQRFPKTDPVIPVSGKDVLYVLYTSGSTGQPKGVEVMHYNMVNFLASMKKSPGLVPEDRLLAVTTISFDIAGLELLLPLVTGACIVLADAAQAKDGRALLDLIRREKVTVMQATPYTYRILLESGWESERMKVLCGGEALPLDLVRKILARASELWNVYGPTETTVWSTLKKIEGTDEQISIGRPIDNTGVYILDESGLPVPTGEIGEIYIAGAGVARGYLNQPALTAERFLPDPFSSEPNARMYRTGDLGRQTPTGDLMYSSRVDQQVKIRGYRIEIGEIEYHLSQAKAVKQGAVVAKADESGVDRLIAFVLTEAHVEADAELIASWNMRLKQSLPDYMVPDVFLVIDEMPLTPNGKVDKKALAVMELPSQLQADTYAAPRTDVEAMVAKIWAEALGMERVGIYDNFFELGGHSLIAVQIMTRIEKETGKHLPLAILFENATVEQLALTLHMDGRSITWDSLVPIKPQGSKIPIYIVHGAGLNVLLFNTLASHMDPEQPVYGLQAKGLNGIDEPLNRIEDIAAYYIQAIRAKNPDGPYALAGYSFGGLVAFEMAKQLEAMGKEVKMLAMFDTYAYRTPHYDPFVMKYVNKGLYFGRKLWYSLTFQEGFKETILHRSEAVKRGMIRAFWKFKPGNKGEQIGFFGYSNKIDQMNQEAMKHYQIKPYPIAIELFRAEKHSFYVDDFIYLGWKPFAQKGVNVHAIPGEHNTIFKAPNDQLFAAILQGCLDKINTLTPPKL